MYYRYESMFDGKYMGCGIMQGLDALDLELDEYEFLIRRFNKELPLPTCFAENKGIKTISYFTEKGNRFFKKDINLIKLAFVSKKFFGVRKIVKDSLPNEKIVYKDDYQIVVLLEEE